jgi:TonB family protein
MRFDWTRGLVLATVAAITWGCNQAPQPEIDAANTALERARGSQAAQHAGNSLREAEQSKAALDNEIQAQSQAWFKSYDRARELALETKAAAERASAEAIAARDVADRKSEARNKAAAEKRAEANRAAAAADVQPPVKIKDVAPIYPAIAKAAGVEGTVTIAAAIDANGYVTGTSVLRSVPMLNQAALDAVKEWQYQPQRVGGKAVPSMVTVNVKFVRS